MSLREFRIRDLAVDVVDDNRHAPYRAAEGTMYTRSGVYDRQDSLEHFEFKKSKHFRYCLRFGIFIHKAFRTLNDGTN